MKYRRLRAPSKHGEVLQDPRLERAFELLNQNVASSRRPKFEFSDAAELIELARKEILQCAIDFTSRYRAVDLQERNTTRLIMAGHQPTLFHPGVWYKNFCLSALADKINCIGLNLIVDNDICDNTVVRIPKLNEQRAVFKNVPFDNSTSKLPFEARKIEEESLFQSFGQRLTGSVKSETSSNANPIVSELWPIVLENRADNLGLSIARGRHLYEFQNNLETLELPISLVAKTRAFAGFLHELLSRITTLQSIYNESLNDYRWTRGIRSKTHPVPSLSSTNGFFETPFWIWEHSNPVRQTLFVKSNKDGVVISNRQNLEFEVSNKNFVDEILALSEDKIAVRPKAIMTTMFSRVLACDLFLHGIGGAKYDELTDQIIERFFEISAPEFLTLTATFRHSCVDDQVERAELARLENHLRDLDFHPEKFLVNPSSDSLNWIKRKEKWIQTELPRKSRLERHQKIVECNQQLGTLLVDAKRNAKKQLSELKLEFENQKILNSRELSFCIFDGELVTKLAELAI